MRSISAARSYVWLTYDNILLLSSWFVNSIRRQKMWKLCELINMTGPAAVHIFQNSAEPAVKPELPEPVSQAYAAKSWIQWCAFVAYSSSYKCLTSHICKLCLYVRHDFSDLPVPFAYDFLLLLFILSSFRASLSSVPERYFSHIIPAISAGLIFVTDPSGISDSSLSLICPYS